MRCIYFYLIYYHSQFWIDCFECFCLCFNILGNILRVLMSMSFSWDDQESTHSNIPCSLYRKARSRSLGTSFWARHTKYVPDWRWFSSFLHLCISFKVMLDMDENRVNPWMTPCFVHTGAWTDNPLRSHRLSYPCPSRLYAVFTMHYGTHCLHWSADPQHFRQSYKMLHSLVSGLYREHRVSTLWVLSPTRNTDWTHSHWTIQIPYLHPPVFPVHTFTVVIFRKKPWVWPFQPTIEKWKSNILSLMSGLL